MRFWETFSKTIFKIAAANLLDKISANSLESVLKKSIHMIDKHTVDEMKTFIKTQQTTSGGFADKGGNPDLYYTLFGFFIAEAIEVDEVMPLLKEYVKEIVHINPLKGVYLKSAVILWAKLFGYATLPPALRIKSTANIQNPDHQPALYTDFINLLASYYSEDYSGLYQVQKRIKTTIVLAGMPCSVTAAQLVLQDIFRKPTLELKIQLNSFYRKNGSFSATRHTPAGDLLSTAVALYALKFVNADLRPVKPDCLNFIDALYLDGGFCATAIDTDPDVEYTFYGLLALGALYE
jgi:hypothetical protein